MPAEANKDSAPQEFDQFRVVCHDDAEATARWGSQHPGCINTLRLRIVVVMGMQLSAYAGRVPFCARPWIGIHFFGVTPRQLRAPYWPRTVAVYLRPFPLSPADLGYVLIFHYQRMDVARASISRVKFAYLTNYMQPVEARSARFDW